MRTQIFDQDDASLEMNRNDQPVLVAADVKHDPIVADAIGAAGVRLHVFNAFPVRLFAFSRPFAQSWPRIGMHRPEITQMLELYDPHVVYDTKPILNAQLQIIHFDKFVTCKPTVS